MTRNMREAAMHPDDVALIARYELAMRRRELADGSIYKMLRQIELSACAGRLGELTAEQIEHIDARLDEAEEASKRIGRKDWLLLFGGTILNLIVTDTVTPSVAGHIFTTVVHGLIHLFTGAGGPPQILAGL